MQAFLDQAVTDEIRPKRTSSGALIVRRGTKYRTLVGPSGRITDAGRYYESIAPDRLPTEGFDMNQTPRRDGKREYISVRGKEKLTRSYDPATNAWLYTRTGREFYARARVDYVIKVPSIHTGTRSNGQPYTRRAFYPIEAPVRLPAAMTPGMRDRRIRTEINRLYPNGLLAEFSEERIVIDPQGAWSVNEMITRPTDDGPETTVQDRPVGVRPSVSSLLFPEHLCQAAFEDIPDRLCVPRQIAQIRRLRVEEVCAELDQCATELAFEDWRVRGATSRMIFLYARRNDLGACCLHGDRVLETAPGPNPLVWAVHGSHAYFYIDRRVCRQLAARIPCAFEKVRRDAGESTTPDVDEWEWWDGSVKPGHFWAEDLDEVRGQLLARGLHARVTLKDDSVAKTLTYRFTRQDPHSGVCVIHSLPAEWKEIKVWLKNLDLGLKYTGEGLANITWKVLLKLLRQREREHLTGVEKHDLMEEHEFSCAMCGSRERVEFDHVQALSTSFCPQTFQPLCVTCHAQKTAQEPREWEQDVLSSHFNSHVWESYVMSDRPPPLVHRVKPVQALTGLAIADVRRCRKRALEMNVHEVPVFSPLDDIEPTNNTLGDIVYVSRPYKNCIRQLGYTGPGWMHRCLAEWLLYTGVICWDDVPYKINATGRLPAHVFKGPLERMERAWEDGLGKQSVNSMIGLWCRDESFAYKLVSSNHPDDAPANSLKRIFTYPGGSIADYVLKTRLTSTTSMRPLWDLCMCTEAMRVGQMLYCLRKQKAIIYELKTDSVLYKCKKEVLEGLKFQDLQVRQLFEPAGQRFLNQHCQLSRHESTEHVYRVAEAQERDPLCVDPKEPQRDARYVHEPMVWRDLSEEQAEAAIVNGQSLLVLGIAGTGKTTLCKGLMERLKALGKRVDVMSKTHTASSRAGGGTADHYVRRHILHGASVADALWVDEIFQLETALWAQLQKLKDRQWLLSGDENQFGALFDQWKGTPVVDRLLRSRLLYLLAGGNRVVLRECRRSERQLFDWYSSLIPGGARFETPLADVLRQARATFKFDNPARYNLCLSHRRRVRLNAELNKHFCPQEGWRLIKATVQRGQLCAAQNMLVWPGLELLGCSRSGRRIKNNVTYKVQTLNDEHLVIESETTENMTLSYAQAAELLRLSFARTYASIQGTDFDDTVRLHDTTSKHFTRRHLFVAMSRCRRAENLAID